MSINAAFEKSASNVTMWESGVNFTDRADAGRQLAARLVPMALDRPVVYALPRGGVPVAAEVARALGAPLDLILVRKIGAPGAPEVALGAIVDGANPQTVINEDVRRRSGADDAWLERARARELAELERRRAKYLGDRPQVDPSGRTAVDRRRRPRDRSDDEGGPDRDQPAGRGQGGRRDPGRAVGRAARTSKARPTWSSASVPKGASEAWAASMTISTS